MNTKRYRRWTWLLATAIVIACSSDTHVGCSPSLTCSLRPSRFSPPLAVDAGPSACDLTQRSCAAAQLSAGGRHACVVTDGSNVICWGDDAQGQRGPSRDALIHVDASLGDAGEYLESFSHVIDHARQVSAGFEHSCALLKDGSVECWGRDSEGQVDGITLNAVVEKPVRLNLSGVTQIDAGALHTCAITERGVVCWGSDAYGQLGRDAESSARGLLWVPGTEGAVEVSCGVRHSCARFGDGTVVCWGEMIDPSGNAAVSGTPTPVAGLEGALQISAGAGHTCALKSDSAVCWGLNDNGQLGDGTTQASATPVRVLELLAGAGSIAAGGGEEEGQLVGHSCAVDRNSQVACWGHNAQGQLGFGVSDDRSKPESVKAYMDAEALDQIAEVQLGASFSCALSSRGAVFCWGDDSADQLGRRKDPERDMRPVPAGFALQVQRFGRQR